MGVRWLGTGVALGVAGSAVGVAVGNGGTVTVSGNVAGGVSGKVGLSGVVACCVGTTQTGVFMEAGGGSVGVGVAGAAVGATVADGAAGDRGAPKGIAGWSDPTADERLGSAIEVSEVGAASGAGAIGW